jgi:hypothetical protein
LPDSNLATDQPLTDYSLTKISNNAKFAAVRPETFYGWYKDGETVQIPTSPVDGYVYSRPELEYEVAAWDARPPASGQATNGVTPKPARASVNSAAGTLFDIFFHVEEKSDANPGLVHCFVSFWDNGTEHQTNSGMVKVRVIATRLSG